MNNDSGLGEEDVLLKRVLLHCVGMKKYYCGFEECQSRECFDTWKHVQQHYKNYHKVTVKKKDAWDESIPKIREVEMNQAEEDAELLLNITGKEQLKRKRSARTDGSSKAQKNHETASPVLTLEAPNPEPIEFTLLLSNSTLLAKLTKDFSALQAQIQSEVMNGMTTQFKEDTTTLASISAKLKEFNDRKLSFEHSVDIGKTKSKEFTPAQKDLLNRIAELNSKEMSSTIEFAKFYLSSLQLCEIQKNPEYIALLALHELLNENL
jgi:predicted nucleic acid-binding protein